MQNYTFIFLFLDSTESEASVTDVYDLDGSSAGVKSVVTEVLRKRRLGHPSSMTL